MRAFKSSVVTLHPTEDLRHIAIALTELRSFLQHNGQPENGLF
jgi:hypothetical protein